MPDFRRSLHRVEVSSLVVFLAAVEEFPKGVLLDLVYFAVIESKGRFCGARVYPWHDTTSYARVSAMRPQHLQ